ncbi:MAG: type II toxin-antitoxin system RelE/ParE family toxin [Candidatus Symbiobacter sp.]|nr:type II toxin-antitoxin system RelE/ParE family toxin [Candidatus Symbiobacter sp.]
MKIFKLKNLARFARKEHISDTSLKEAVLRAENGLVDADLGGGLIKQRISRAGQGRSGGYRTIIAYKIGDRAFLLYGYAKNDLDNIDKDYLMILKKIGRNFMIAANDELDDYLLSGELEEIDYDQR